MDYDRLLLLVKARRSIRRFKTDPVPEEYIQKMLDVARWSPSGFNTQPWEFVVVTDNKLRKEIVRIYQKQETLRPEMEETRDKWQGPWKMHVGKEAYDYTTAPVYILVCADNRMIEALPMPVRFDFNDRMLTHISGLAGAFIYMQLAATTLGLASQWVSRAHSAYVQCMLKDLIGLPSYIDVYDMMALGYPAIKKIGGKLVRPLEEMVHFNYCGKEAFRTDEQVRDFIRKTRRWVLSVHGRPADES